MDSDKIGIAEACALLDVSRPTFDSYRKRYKFRETKSGAKIFFSRAEILLKTPPRKAPKKALDLIIISTNTIADVQVAADVFDLRKLNLVDPHGIMSLLCAILSKADEGVPVSLLVDDSFEIQKLASLGFFLEIERRHRDAVTWDRSKVRGLAATDPNTFLPIQYIGHKGGERQSATDLIKLLIKHGFTEEIGAKIGWIFGELADNSLTHGKGPCYLMCERYITNDKGSENYLAVAIADMGIGIHSSLRTNPKYAELDDKTALTTAFKSRVSSWPDKFDRGKGLTDVLKISLGNKSYFRVDSGALGFSIDFDRGARMTQPMSSVAGTRYTIVLTDGAFSDVSREEADAYVEKNLKTL